MGDVVAGVGRGAVGVFIAAGFAVTVSGIAPVTGLAIGRFATGGDTVGVLANLAGQGTIDVVYTFLHAFAVNTAGKVRILAVGVGLAFTGLFGNAGAEVAQITYTTIVDALADRWGRHALVVHAD